MAYFDNAATSWPKPPCVKEAIADFIDNIGANPGRSGHSQSIEAGRVVNRARVAVADIFNVADPMRVAFSHNATHSLNTVLRGLLGNDGEAITSSMEHNSVIRPLRDLEPGIKIHIIECDELGRMAPDALNELISPQTKVVVINHASNVNGSIAPIRELASIARDNGVPFVLDAAQTAGSVPIDMKRDLIDIACFTGHKSLLGPMGIGGMVLGEDFDEKTLPRLLAGGTGSRSELETHPDFLPDKYESGTLNAMGLAGLAAGLGYIQERTIEDIREKEASLTKRFLDGASNISGLVLHSSSDQLHQTSVVSFNITGIQQSTIGQLLDEQHGIMSRVGLHCAPMAHKALGTFPGGTVRFSFGCFNKAEQVDRALEALEQIASSNKK